MAEAQKSNVYDHHTRQTFIDPGVHVDLANGSINLLNSCWNYLDARVMGMQNDLDDVKTDLHDIKKDLAQGCVMKLVAAIINRNRDQQESE